MIAPELVKELQKLNREEKLQVIQFLNDELSDDIDRFPKGARLFKTWPTKISSEGRDAMRRILDEEHAPYDG